VLNPVERETTGMKLWFCTYKIILVACSSLFVGYVTREFVPECLGGGTIATKVSLAISSPIPFYVGFCRLIFSSIYVGMGNPLGIEAPTIHLSAAVASALRTARCIPDSLPVGLPLAMVLGCCGGLSAAFNSPLSGIVFAIEEYMDIRQEGKVTALVLLSSMCSSLVTRTVDPVHTMLFPIKAEHNLSGGYSSNGHRELMLDFGSNGFSSGMSNANNNSVVRNTASVGIEINDNSILNWMPEMFLRHLAGGGDADSEPNYVNYAHFLISILSGIAGGLLIPGFAGLIIYLRSVMYQQTVFSDNMVGGAVGLICGLLGAIAYLTRFL